MFNSFSVRHVTGKLHRGFEQICYFSTREWTFKSDNRDQLIASMNNIDRCDFPCDVAAVNWEEYMRSVILSMRRHVLKESDDSLPAARVRYRR